MNLHDWLIAACVLALATYAIRLAGTWLAGAAARSEHRLGRLFEPAGPALIAAFVVVSLVPVGHTPALAPLGGELLSMGLALWVQRLSGQLWSGMLVGLVAYGLWLAAGIGSLH
ncbi:AzlD domain-containing protein [Acidihalobacter yilgarnensis]|nr:AzlD domain-containing protein [Acidihalobacter yilgarnensis]